MLKSWQIVCTENENECRTSASCRGKVHRHVKGTDRCAFDFSASRSCVRWHTLEEQLLCLTYQRKNILSPSSIVYVKMTVRIHPPFRRITACKVRVTLFPSSPFLSPFSFTMKLCRSGLFKVAGLGTDAAGTLLGNRSSSGSTGLGGAGQAFIWLST